MIGRRDRLYALQRAGKRSILPKARPDYLRMCDENMENPTDEEIKEILKRAENFAVVGLSDKPGFILAGVGQGGIAIRWQPVSRCGATRLSPSTLPSPYRSPSHRDPEGWERKPWGRGLTLGWKISPNL